MRVLFAGAEETGGYDRIVDCTGAAQIGHLPGLRGVRGEMLALETGEVHLSRPVRLLHPRHPLYVVPWADGFFMVGATVIESEEAGPVSVRSALQLLGAAYALHPALAEAEIVEAGAGVRPAFPDNVPKIVVRGRTIHVNGLYRHGFLMAPALAELATKDLFTANVKTDDDIRAVLRQRVDTVYHPVGSCKMGSDDMAVVDATLKVHGVQGLRVVDASIMPTLIGGNTNAPAIMIGEKAADMIRNGQ